jgi:hypothetical protein
VQTFVFVSHVGFEWLLENERGEKGKPLFAARVGGAEHFASILTENFLQLKHTLTSPVNNYLKNNAKFTAAVKV